MNFLTQQTIMNGNHLPAGPHFVHCHLRGPALLLWRQLPGPESRP